MKKASGVEIAEYAGRRVDSPRGLQMLDRAGATLGCPFSGGACSKLSRSNGQHPVCSLRVNGDLYPVCTDRIIPAKSERQSQDHLVVLGQLAEALFPGVDPKSIAFKRQVSLSPKNRDSAGEGKTRATKLFLDYLLTVNPPVVQAGRTMAFVEIQGGGETSNTGTITKFLDSLVGNPDAARLIQSLPAGANPIPNNAYKRQLPQLIEKAVLAKSFNGGAALVMGTYLYDYVLQRVPLRGQWYPDWEVSLVEVTEDPKLIGDNFGLRVNRSAFGSMADLLSAWTSPPTITNPMVGKWQRLNGMEFELPAE
jgi:hypothetical protein